VAARAPLGRSGSDAPSVVRLVSFSDAVFAIAITLLAIQLRVPEIKDPKSGHELSRALGDLSGQFFTYGITFVLIGVYWLGHHRMFQHITRHNRRLAELNLLFLFTISFMPFPADLLGRYPHNRTAVIVYASTLTVVTLMSVALWEYAVRAGLTEPDLNPRFRYYFTLRPLVIAAVFAASIGVAFVNVTAASRLWFVAFPALLVMRLVSRDPED
jgi:uncharacterized membrane protein